VVLFLCHLVQTGDLSSFALPHLAGEDGLQEELDLGEAAVNDSSGE
jgi:hypothetical protein